MNYPQALISIKVMKFPEETLDGQHQRVDIPARARAAHKALLQKRLEEDLC